MRASERHAAFAGYQAFQPLIERLPLPLCGSHARAVRDWADARADIPAGRFVGRNPLTRAAFKVEIYAFGKLVAQTGDRVRVKGNNIANAGDATEKNIVLIIKIDAGSKGGGRIAAARTLSNYGIAIEISSDSSIKGFALGQDNLPEQIFTIADFSTLRNE